MTKSGARPIGASARASGILLAGSFVSKALRLGGDLLVGRVLGPAGFGVIAAATSLAGILGEIALLGTHRAVLRFASLGGAVNERALARRAMAVPLVVGFACVAAITLARESMTRVLFGDAVSPWLLPAFSLTIPAIGALSVLQFLARARHRFFTDTFVGDVCRTGLPFAGTALFFALGGATLTAATAGFVVGTLVSVLVAMAMGRRAAAPADTPTTASIPSPVSSESLRQILRVGLPLALGSVSMLLLNELDKVMLAAFRPEEEVGVYNAAFRIARQILIVMPALNAAISPFVAPLLAEGRVDDLRHLYKRTVRWSLAAGWSATLLFCGFAGDFLGLFGDDYRAGAHVLVVVCLGHLVNAAAGTVAVVIQYSGNERKELWNGILVIVASLSLNFALIPPFGAVGAAYSSFLALSLVNGLRMVQAWRILDVMPYDKGTLGVLGAGVLGLALGWGAKGVLAVAGSPASPALGVAAATIGMTLAWGIYFWRVGVTEEEAAMLRLPRRFVRGSRGSAAVSSPLPASSDPESAFAPHSRSPECDTTSPRPRRSASKASLPPRP